MEVALSTSIFSSPARLCLVLLSILERAVVSPYLTTLSVSRLHTVGMRAVLVIFFFYVMW